MIIKGAKVFQEDGTFIEKNLYIEGQKIITYKEADENEEIIDGSGLYAIPGLIDIHFHGCMNYDFCDGTKEALDAIAKYQASQGVTAIMPATLTLDEERLTQICTMAKEYDNIAGAELVGINLEGPFLSVKKKGAQNPDYMQVPSVEMYRRLQKASGGLIKVVCVAPEEDKDFAFIKAIKDEVKVSLAHTVADYQTATKAFEAGAKHVTHLHNAMPSFLHREPGVVGAAFDHKDCRVELICEGVSVSDCMVRATFAMFGDERIIMISDSMMATGMPDGQYSLGGLDVTVKDNMAVLTQGGAIAGSIQSLMQDVQIAVKQMHIPLGSAIKCASLNPAKEIGIDDLHGSLEVNKYANIVLIDKDVNIKKVILKGEKL